MWLDRKTYIKAVNAKKRGDKLGNLGFNSKSFNLYINFYKQIFSFIVLSLFFLPKMYTNPNRQKTTGVGKSRLVRRIINNIMINK